FKAASDLLARLSAPFAEIKTAVAELIAFGQGADSIFGLHNRELVAGVRADQTIEMNVAIQRELDEAAADLVAEAEISMKRGTAQLIENLDSNRTLLFIVAVASIVSAGGICVFYVRRKLIRRLTSIGDAMRHLSCGETDLAVPAIGD